MVTTCPATACVQVAARSHDARDACFAPEGCTRMRWPRHSVPLAIWPEKPRKSRLGRLTHCTGRRNGWRCVRASSSGDRLQVRHQRGPSYQGMAALGAVMLSPFSADIGMR
jgi:hypothetical protein